MAIALIIIFIAIVIIAIGTVTGNISASRARTVAFDAMTIEQQGRVVEVRQKRRNNNIRMTCFMIAIVFVLFIVHLMVH